MLCRPRTGLCPPPDAREARAREPPPLDPQPAALPGADGPDARGDPRRTLHRARGGDESAVGVSDFEPVVLGNGEVTGRDGRTGELMHPGLGPEREAELLYVRQTRL